MYFIRKLPVLLLAAAILSGAQAVADDAPRPDAYGLWIVGHRIFELSDASREDRILEVRVWYPADPASASGDHSYYLSMDIVIAQVGRTSDIAYDDLPVSSAGPFPLIVFSHGATSLNLQSIDLVETLASHGFVVAAPNHTGDTTLDMMNNTLLPREEIVVHRPADVSFLIDELLVSSDFENSIDSQSLGVAGHSFGAFTALLCACGMDHEGIAVDPDPRITAFMPVSIGGTDTIAEARISSITNPFLFLGGTEDDMTPIDPNTTRLWELLGSPERYRADVVGATHTHFANVCEVGDALIEAGLDQSTWPSIGAEQLVWHYEVTCTEDAFPIEEAQRIQNLYAVSFFRRHLADDQRYADYLTVGYAEDNEPDVVYFTTVSGESQDCSSCGMGAEPVILLLILALRRRYFSLETK